MVNILDRPQHVDIEILSAILNFHGLNHGDVLNDQFLGAYGIKISGGYIDNNGNTQPRDPVVFDTELTGTRDFDLEVNIGNISIVQENDIDCNTGTCSLPDDNAAGGFQKFQFDPIRYVNSLVWIDADRPEPFGTIYLFGDYDCDNYPNFDPDAPDSTLIDSINIPFTGDKTTQVLVPVNIEQVGCMIADYRDSGGLSRLNLGCPLPDDPLTMPWFQDDHQSSSSEETVFFTDFENPWEIEEWDLDASSSGNEIWGNYFDIIVEGTQGGDWWAHSGWNVLAGWGNFDPDKAAYNRNAIDISDYHDVIVSVHYSYEDTEDADEFFLNYKDGNNWVPIINVPSPQSSSSQSNWMLAEANIPDHIDSLVIQFRWSSSSGSEHMMIDNLEVFGIPN